MHADLATPSHITLRSCRPHRDRIQVVAAPHTNRFRSAPIAKERGAALIITLLILLIMTLLGISAITTSSLQEKMAGNMRDQYMAQQAGDSILREAESWIRNLATRPTKSCAPSAAERVWHYSCLDVSAQNDAWWAANGYTPYVGNSYVNQNPRYANEVLQQVPDQLGKQPPVYWYYYRTNGWSVGASDYARGLLQSVLSRRSDGFTNP